MKTFVHPKIKFVSVSGVGNVETRETLVEKKLQEAQSKKKFKDSGERVKGSKKEKAAISGLITVLDLVALEQDEITAYEMVVKDKVWSKLNVDELKRNNVESGVGYLLKELRSAYAGKPLKKTVQMRKSYVVLATYFQNQFAKINTVDELKEFGDKFYKLKLMDAIMIYLPDEAHLFENKPEHQAELNKRFSEWQTRQLLKEIAGKEFYNLLFRYNSEAAVSKWIRAKKYTENNDWSWAEKKTVEHGEQSEITINTGLPLAYIKRTGGLSITDVSEKFIINTLGFKYLEFGNYVRDTEANEHLRHFIGAYIDLCDVLNVNAKQITQLNNLSIAFGSRGKAGAMAFYQPVRNIIALTKKRGDGTVAHEWFHYLDHLVNRNSSLNPDGATLFSGSGMNVKENCIKLKYAFKNILTYIEKGNYFEITGWSNSTTPILKHISVEKSIQAYTSKEIYQSQSKIRYGIEIKDTVDETLSAFKKRYPSYFTSALSRKDKAKKVFGFIAHKFNLPSITVDISEEITSSLYYHYSSKMKSKYWVEPEELFARAFETYMYDKLENLNRFNNYLVSGSYFDSSLNLYPLGKDREILYILFENLFIELKEALNLKPFEAFTDHRSDEYINFDEKKESEIVSSGVIIETINNKDMEIKSAKAKALALEIELELLSLDGLSGYFTYAMQKVSSLVKDAINKVRKKKDWETINIISEKESERIKIATGINLLGYERVVDYSGIIHTINKHGNPIIENQKGQVAVMEKDFLLIDFICKKPDSISLSSKKNHRGMKVIIYQKLIGDTYYYLEEVRKGRKKVALENMYKKKAP